MTERICFILSSVVASLREKFSQEDGMATLETVLIITVLIALALMFKDTIVDFVDGVLQSISGQGAAFDPSAIAP